MHPMTCKDYQDSIMRYFDHDLSNPDRQLLDRHLNSCSLCSALFLDLTGILSSLENSVQIEPPLELERLILKKVRLLPTPGKTAQNELVKVIYGSVALLSALVLVIICIAIGDTGFFELLLAGSSYLDSLSNIALILQILYQNINPLFSPRIASLFREIQVIGTLTMFITVFMAARRVFSIRNGEESDIA